MAAPIFRTRKSVMNPTSKDDVDGPTSFAPGRTCRATRAARLHISRYCEWLRFQKYPGVNPGSFHTSKESPLGEAVTVSSTKRSQRVQLPASPGQSPTLFSDPNQLWPVTAWTQSPASSDCRVRIPSRPSRSNCAGKWSHSCINRGAGERGEGTRQ